MRFPKLPTLTLTLRRLRQDQEMILLDEYCKSTTQSNDRNQAVQPLSFIIIATANDDARHVLVGCLVGVMIGGAWSRCEAKTTKELENVRRRTQKEARSQLFTRRDIMMS